MTYCLGMLLPDGLVLASDSRSNAGVDQIATVKKMALFRQDGAKAIVVMSAGNLATTQAVVTMLKQAQGTGGDMDIFNRVDMFGVAQLVGDTLNNVILQYSQQVAPYGNPSASFLVGGQVGGEKPRLFQIYSAGNFIEASPRNHFVQIGETKYGKPILDRALTSSTGLEEGARLALLSFDATIRSNLSVAPPIDLCVYRKDSLALTEIHKFNNRDPYFSALAKGYSEGLGALVEGLPTFPPPPPTE